MENLDKYPPNTSSSPNNPEYLFGAKVPCLLYLPKEYCTITSTINRK